MSKRDKAMWGARKAAGLAVRKDGTLQPAVESSLTRVLSVQRPVVLAYLRHMRRRFPDDTPQLLAERIGRHYLRLSMGAGAAVGAAAAVPGIGTAAAVGVSAAETVSFLEASALYAQAMAELHGMAVADPPRANALVLGLMLGKSGKKMVKQFSQQNFDGTTNIERTGQEWASMVTSTIPAQLMNSLVKKMRREVIKRYGTKSAGAAVGRILPFGIGAVVGIAVNRSMAKLVVESAQGAFGAMPDAFSPETDPRTSSEESDRNLLRSLKELAGRITRKKGAQPDAPAQLEAGADAGASAGADGEDAHEFDDAELLDVPRTYRR